MQILNSVNCNLAHHTFAPYEIINAVPLALQRDDRPGNSAGGY